MNGGIVSTPVVLCQNDLLVPYRNGKIVLSKVIIKGKKKLTDKDVEAISNELAQSINKRLGKGLSNEKEETDDCE